MAEQVFVARERELGRLDGFLGKALAGHGQVCFVTGEAGAGKTALVTEFARRAQVQHDDLLVAIGECNAQTGIGDPYLPFRQVLGLLTGDVEANGMDAALTQGAITQENAGRLRRFLRVSGEMLVEYGPDLIDVFVPGAALASRVAGGLARRTGWMERLDKLTERKATGPDETDIERGDIFEEYTKVLQTLAAEQPLMLVLDDLQWADVGSISLLFHLGRSIGESRILIVGAYRPEDVALGRGDERHPLESVLNEFRRYFGHVWVDLGQADEAEGRRFVDAFLDTGPNRLGEAFRQALFRHTGGHPLFTAELLRDMRERGDLMQDEHGCWIESSALDWGKLPARVEGVIEERIGRLEEELREILTVAAVEGEDFTVQVIARVQEIRERQLLHTLFWELDKRHGLVREQGEVKADHHVLSRYQFAHALFQQYLYNGLSTGERRLLHGEIAAVLEELYEGHTEVTAVALQLARHYIKAGQGEKAIEYLLLAGDKARGLYAHQEAIDHYQRALGFLKEQGDFGRAARTLMKLGLTYHIAFDFPQARQAYDEGFTLWQQSGEMQPVVSPSPAGRALRIGWNDPATLDPTMADEFASVAVIGQLFAGLVQLTPRMNVVPDVARSWEVSEGGRRYVFHLRDDARWSDGMPVTAGDFEFAWKRVLDPGVGSPLASFLYDVRGARAFHRGEVSDPGQVGVRALDKATLVVELEGPTGYFPHVLACSATLPLPQHVVEAYGNAWVGMEDESVGPVDLDIVTNGPFRLDAWQRNESMVLIRSSEYHGQFTGNVQRVELSLFEDASARLEMYETGDLDVLDLSHLSPLETDRARQRHAGEYISAPGLTTYYVGFDVRKPPFDDLRVRRAFVQAADREPLADVVLRGYAFPATGGLVPPGMPGHSSGIGLPYDPVQAQHLLAEAGYPGGRAFPVVNLLTPSGRESEAGYLQAQWRGNLGAKITPKTAGWGALLDMLDKERPHMFLVGWRADYPDPDNFLRVCLDWHHTGWQNAVYDRLVEEARGMTDQGQRMRIYQEADRVLIEQAALMPLTYDRLHLLVKPWVRRYPTSPVKVWFWKDVVIEPR